MLAKNPDIKVVSSQAADWDAAKAKAITQTVLKQNPDLCGIVGFWDGMDIGTAAAIKEAGLTGKVFLATSGGGEQKGACDLVKSGAFDLDLSYDVPTQAEQHGGMIKWLLRLGLKPGSVKGSIYTTLIPITKDNAAAEGTCWNLSDLKKLIALPVTLTATGRAPARPLVPGRRSMEDVLRFTRQPMQDALLRLALPLLARPPARRDPRQALDRDGDPGDRADDRRVRLSRAIPGFLSVGRLADTGRQAGEIGFIVLGMALVMIVGGIDLSVGSMFALSDFCALYCLNVLKWPVARRCSLRRSHAARRSAPSTAC